MKKVLFYYLLILSCATFLVIFLIYDQILESAWRPNQKFCIETDKFEVIRENGRSIDELYVVKKYETYYPKRTRNNSTLLGFPRAKVIAVKIVAAFDTEAEAEEYLKSK